MRAVLCLLVVAAVGCDAAEDEPSTCAGRSGLYEASYTTKSGNCGPVPGSVTNVNASRPDGCVGDVQNSADMCGVQMDVICPIQGYQERIRFTGAMQWSRDGGRGDGTLGISLIDPSGAQLCSGVYQVRYTRL